jgi:hypothetical protein
MPAVLATAVANVVNAGAFSVGNFVFIQPIGYLSITALNTGANTLTLQNPGYNVNEAPGSTAPSGNQVTATGPQGPQGNIGPTGSQGIQGVAGATGATGPAGPTGSQGSVGNTGAQGVPGPAGQGFTWAGAWSAATAYTPYLVVSRNGSSYTCTVANTNIDPATDTTHWNLIAQMGLQGNTGAAGPQGVAGTPGAAGQGYNWRSAWSGAVTYNAYDCVGYQGSSYVCILGNTNQLPTNATYWNVLSQIGATGATGPQGNVGATGSQGIQGNPGPTGSIGPTGPTGQGFTWRSGWDSATAYNPYDVVSYTGSSYVCISPNTNQPPTNPTYWSIIAQVGSTGATGATGSTGAQGPVGTTGATGGQGPAGAAATVSVGTTNNLSPGSAATVSNSGTPSAAVLNFGIPIGQTGVQGVSGLNAFNTLVSGFTVPPVGQTVVITLNDASWVVVGQYVYVDQAAGGPGNAGVLQVTAKTGNQITLLNPSPPVPAVPIASPSQAGLVNPLSGGLTDYLGGDNACHPLGTEVIATVPLASASTRGLLGQLNGQANSYVGGDNACHTISLVSGFVAKTAAYTLTTADSGKYILCSGNGWTLTLPAAQAGLVYYLRNDQGLVAAGTITVQPTSGLIDGAASINLLPSQECTILSDGSNWRTFGLKREVILGTQDITSPQANGTVLLPVGFRVFELEWTNIIVANDNQHIAAYFSNNGGASWFTSAGYYYAAVYGLGTSGVAGGGINTGINFAYLGYWGSSIVGGYTIIRLTLNPGRANNYPTYLSQGGSFSIGNNYANTDIHYGLCTVGYGPVNGLQYFSPASGNINQSFLTVKGIV